SSCHNVEWVEVNFPLLHIFRRHVQDSAGAGKFRGGVAEETALILHDSPNESVTFVALGTAGLRNGGQGIFGGYYGAPSLLVHMTDTAIRDVLGKNQAPTDLEALGGKRRLVPYCRREPKGVRSPQDAVRPKAAATDDHPLQESLAIRTANGTQEIQCTKCSYALCAADEDWREDAVTRRIPPAATGPLMAVLNGQFL